MKRLSPKTVLGFIVALIVAFVLLFSCINVLQKYIGIRRHIRELSEEKKALEQKHQMLTEQNQYLETPEGKERILREKYNVTKPGEGVVLIVDPEQSVVDLEKNKPGSWWQKLFAGLGLRK